jgi:hypothetical protein
MFHNFAQDMWTATFLLQQSSGAIQHGDAVFPLGTIIDIDYHQFGNSQVFILEAEQYVSSYLNVNIIICFQVIYSVQKCNALVCHARPHAYTQTHTCVNDKNWKTCFAFVSMIIAAVEM